MLLSEGLAQRKQALRDIDDLGSRAKEASVKYADDEGQGEADEILSRLNKAIDDYGDLSVRINKTNNVTRVNFDGHVMTIMEAVAFRETLLFSARQFRAIADHVRQSVRGRELYGARRTKDDIKQVATVDAENLRKQADKASETVRRLDIVLQQKNWTTELVD